MNYTNLILFSSKNQFLNHVKPFKVFKVSIYPGKPHPKGKHQELPTGLDYKAPDNYDPASNPTFPKKKFKPKLAGREEEGYDYAPPPSYEAGVNPTFPKVRFSLFTIC